MECPPEYDGQIYSAAIYSVPLATEGSEATAYEATASSYDAAATTNTAAATQVYWFEYYTEDSGEVYYQSNGDDAAVVYERPAGDVYIVCQNEETSAEDHWLEQYDADSQTVQYVNYATGEVIGERPINGTVMIIQTL
jgi:hypothetical protein